MPQLPFAEQLSYFPVESRDACRLGNVLCVIIVAAVRFFSILKNLELKSLSCSTSADPFQKRKENPSKSSSEGSSCSVDVLGSRHRHSFSRRLELKLGWAAKMPQLLAGFRLCYGAVE